MNAVVFVLGLALASLASAGRLENTYLPPPNAGSAGGQDLSLPFRSSEPHASYLPPSGPSTGETHTRASFSQTPSTPSNTYLPASVSVEASHRQSAPYGPQANSFRQSSSSSQSSYGSQNAFAPKTNAFGSQSYSSGSKSTFGSQSSSSYGSQQSSFGAQSSTNTRSGSFASQGAVSTAPAARQVAIIKQVNENVGDGSYTFSYETEDGIQAEERGELRQDGAEGLQSVQGSFSYTGPDNVRYSVSYTADENGFQAFGDHLPTPPPVPEAIQRALEINAREEAESQRSGASSHEGSSHYRQNQGGYQYPSGNSHNQYQGQQEHQYQNQKPAQFETSKRQGSSSTDHGYQHHQSSSSSSSNSGYNSNSNGGYQY